MTKASSDICHHWSVACTEFRHMSSLVCCLHRVQTYVITGLMLAQSSDMSSLVCCLHRVQTYVITVLLLAQSSDICHHRSDACTEFRHMSSLVCCLHRVQTYVITGLLLAQSSDICHHWSDACKIHEGSENKKQQVDTTGKHRKQ